jgi:hypothetical protein
MLTYYFTSHADFLAAPLHDPPSITAVRPPSVPSYFIPLSKTASSPVLLSPAPSLLNFLLHLLLHLMPFSWPQPPFDTASRPAPSSSVPSPAQSPSLFSCFLSPSDTASLLATPTLASSLIPSPV